MKQSITSAKTSVNKIPAVFKTINLMMKRPEFFWSGVSNSLDYGGGRFDTFTDLLGQMGVRNWVYDPFNRSEEHNAFVRKMLSPKRLQADIAFLSCVLNVIKEPSVRREILEDIKTMVKPGGDVFITVYEGDRMSRGRRTTRGWQSNRPIQNYMREIRKVYPGATGYNGLGRKVIVATVPFPV